MTHTNPYNFRLKEKLAALQTCILQQADEDAEMHLFDLISALRLRAATRPAMRPEDLTPEGEATLLLLEREPPPPACTCSHPSELGGPGPQHQRTCPRHAPF